MKPKGKHPDRRLSALGVRKLGPGRHGDGNGLYLSSTTPARVVGCCGPSSPAGGATSVSARRPWSRSPKRASSPPVTASSHAKAATRSRSGARRGGESRPSKRRRARSTPSTKGPGRTRSTRRSGSRRSKSTRFRRSARSRSTASSRRTSSACSRRSGPTPETARRVRQRIKTVLDWAKARGYRTGENPVAGVGGGKGLPKHNGDGGHFAALPYADLPGFFEKLRAQAGPRRACARIRDPDRGAHWRDARRNLVGVRSRRRDLVDPGRAHESRRRASRPALRGGGRDPARDPRDARRRDLRLRGEEGKAALEHGDDDDAPAHGTRRRHGPRLRSALRDWCAEQTNVPREIAEKALAHVLTSKTEAAYQRGDLSRSAARSWTRGRASRRARGSRNDALPVARRPGRE